MKRSAFVICLVFLFALGVQAQGKVASQWNCGKATAEHSVEVGDQPGHAYAVSQSKCTAVKGEIEGVKEKEGSATELRDVMGSNLSWNGTFVDTLADGDKIHVSYKGTGTAKGNQFVSGNHTWTIIGGTGKFKGAKGEGGCKGKGNPDGTAIWNCTGTYTLAAAAPAKKK